MKGLVHVYTGGGKGKTTASVGLGVRAYGRGLKVLMVQFLKGNESGEHNAIAKLGDGFKVNPGKPMVKFTWNMNKQEYAEATKIQREQFEYAVKEANSGRWDMLILDEIMATITTGMIPVESVASFIKSKPDSLEVVMTGRDAPEELVCLADYVSEIKEIKHPMYKGIPARRGIED